MILNNNKYCCELELKTGCVHFSILPHPPHDLRYQLIIMNEIYFGRLKVAMIKKKHKQNLCGLKKDDKIRLFKNGETGTIRYIGNLMKTTMVGIELDEKNMRARDGKFCGKEYFKVDKGYGLFVRKEDIECKLCDNYSPYIMGNKFRLELDLKNHCFVLLDHTRKNPTKWSIDLQEIDDLQKVRISLFLEENIGNAISLINEFWHKL